MNPMRNPSPEEQQRYFVDEVPHNVALGLRCIEGGEGRVVLDLPWKQELVGDPESGVLHGGAITALFDAACAGAVVSQLENLCRIVTLDLRIDYLRPATPRQTVRCEGVCYHMTRSIAWARGTAFHVETGKPVATAIGTFMILHEGGPHVRFDNVTLRGGDPA